MRPYIVVMSMISIITSAAADEKISLACASDPSVGKHYYEIDSKNKVATIAFENYAVPIHGSKLRAEVKSGEIELFYEGKILDELPTEKIIINRETGVISYGQRNGKIVESKTVCESAPVVQIVHKVSITNDKFGAECALVDPNQNQVGPQVVSTFKEFIPPETGKAIHVQFTIALNAGEVFVKFKDDEIPESQKKELYSIGAIKGRVLNVNYCMIEASIEVPHTPPIPVVFNACDGLVYYWNKPGDGRGGFRQMFNLIAKNCRDSSVDVKLKTKF